jgi:multisubunit Na+/H+ antiporter MnhE subunit
MISALIVSLIAWRIKIITKYSHFLFLHVGFYKHFIGIIAYYFLESLKIAFNAARNKQDNYKIYSLPIKKLNNTELVLLISTINLLPGTIFIGIEGEKINIFALDKKYIEKLNLDKICDSLEKINDNRLV